MQQEARRLERAERRFRRDIWSVAPVDAVYEAGVRMEWFGPILASVFADLPEAAGLNLIQGADEADAVVAGHLARAIEWVRGFGVEFMVPVASGRPETERAEEWLQWHHYEQGLVMKRQARRPAPPIRTDPLGVEVSELPAEEDELIAILVAEGMNLPGLAEILFIGLPRLENWRCYVAHVDGELVATGSTMLHDGVATLGVDATMPYFRGCGCHRALLERRLEDVAAEPKVELVQAFSSDMPGGEPSRATRSLRRAGFSEVGTIVNWRLPGGSG